MELTQEQEQAVETLYVRNPDGAATYEDFRKRVGSMFLGQGAVSIVWCCMYVGIETDGHTHT